MADISTIIHSLQSRFGAPTVTPQTTADGMPTIWVPAARIREILRWLKAEAAPAYPMLYDLTALDERARAVRPDWDFTVVYELLSLERNEDLRVKVALTGDYPTLDSIADLWANANWYEREVWDMFGIRFAGHPHLTRILLPPWWEGHPLRKEHPARATELPPFQMPDAQQAELESALEFRPEDWGLAAEGGGFEYMFLNLGPHHPGTHGVLRLILQMRGQEIHDAVCEIGFHHRGAEKMGERQSWHTYIPYTDRVDYLGGVLNNFPYVLAVEKLAGIEPPPRAQVIRVMLAELFRIISHLVFYGTFAQDLGMLSPVFYMFSDREHALDIVEAITGARMHPGWFRIGGVAQDLPEGWDGKMREFLQRMRKHLGEYDRAVLRNDILIGRSRGISELSTAEAIEWGATGPMLRATGLAWDWRKQRPYGGYEQYDFDIPTGTRGDCYDRVLVHAEEMRQSLRIIEQCVENMPPGDYKSRHPRATPPLKERHTMYDIETLIDHFLSVSWGPVVPPGEASCRVEAAKGANSYYLTSDGNTMSYRTRIRTPSFAHIQMLPRLTRGFMIPDLIAILGSLDFVLADVDR